MTTAMHTPGPLFVRHGANGFFEIMDGPDFDTARVLCTRFEWKECAAEMRANGDLFAAAPDLLAALHALSVAVDNLDPQSGIPIGYQALLDAAAAADALIAKATGVVP